jgi:hypothetical protein
MFYTIGKALLILMAVTTAIPFVLSLFWYIRDKFRKPTITRFYIYEKDQE